MTDDVTPAAIAPLPHLATPHLREVWQEPEPAVRITAFRMVRAEPRSDGACMVATFDCQLAGLHIRECRLLRRPDGELVVVGPRCASSGRSERPAVSFIDESLRAALVAKASAAFLALGGGA